jgi:hypothetical protein
VNGLWLLVWAGPLLFGPTYWLCSGKDRRRGRALRGIFFAHLALLVLLFPMSWLLCWLLYRLGLLSAARSDIPVQWVFYVLGLVIEMTLAYVACIVALVYPWRVPEKPELDTSDFPRVRALKEPAVEK